MSAHLNLKGLVDPAKEKEKLEKKKVTLETQVDKLKKLTAVKGMKFLDNLILQRQFILFFYLN